ncbi:hypothetical protein D3C71_1399040 [compost metagenome]
MNWFLFASVITWAAVFIPIIGVFMALILVTGTPCPRQERNAKRSALERGDIAQTRMSSGTDYAVYTARKAVGR